MNNFYSVFLNLTDNCNFACMYCYEKDCTKTHVLDLKNAENICNFLLQNKDSLMSFDKNLNRVLVHFFGGEPTLNPVVLEYIYNRLYNDSSFNFSIVTNGYIIDDIRRIFRKDNRIHIQVSYDGYDVQNVTRPHKNGFLTTDTVRDNIETLMDDGYNVTVKSVITPYTFHLMESAYLDILDIFESRSKTGSYFPTIDYYTDYGYSEEYMSALEQSLIKISKHELEYMTQHGFPFLKMMDRHGNKRCGAGISVIGIDTDLSVVPCEGAFQKSGNNDHLIGNLLDADIVDKIHNWRDTLVYSIPGECSQCDTDTCLKCNIVKYFLSKKKTYNERWCDFAIQPNLCKYYRKIDGIKRALWYIYEEEKRR